MGVPDVLQREMGPVRGYRPNGRNLLWPKARGEFTNRGVKNAPIPLSSLDGGLWNPERKTHIAAAKTAYLEMAGRPGNGARREEMAEAMREIENFLVDCKAVDALVEIRSARGLSTIAKFHDDKVAAVSAIRALGQLKAIVELEGAVEFSKTPHARIEAAKQLRGLAIVNKTNPSNRAESYSEAVYKLFAIVLNTNDGVAREAAFLELASIAIGKNELGEIAMEKLRLVGIHMPKSAGEWDGRIGDTGESLKFEPGMRAIVDGVLATAVLDKMPGRARSHAHDDLKIVLDRLVTEHSNIAELFREIEGITYPGDGDSSLVTNAWETWRSDGRLGRLADSIRQLA